MATWLGMVFVGSSMMDISKVSDMTDSNAISRIIEAVALEV